MIGQERREFYPEFKETDLEVLRPFVPQPDLLKNPSLEEELETFQRDLFHLLNQPETCQQINEIGQIQNQIVELESNWQERAKKLGGEIATHQQGESDLRAQWHEKEKDLSDRERDKNEGRVGVAFGRVWVAAAKHWPSTTGLLDSLGLITTILDFKEPLHRHLRPLFEELAALDKPLKELERKREMAHQEYEQSLEGKSERKEELEKELLDRLTEWVVEDRDRVIILILNNPESLEKWMAAYLKRAVEKPTQEEVLSYLTWALQTYGIQQEKTINKSRFRQWVSFCFENKSPQEVGELLSPRKSQDFEEELARSFDHFAQSLKHPYLKENFSQFLRWWLHLELKLYWLPTKETEPSLYFLRKKAKKRKVKEKLKKEEILRPAEIAEEPFLVLIAGQEKPLNQEELRKYLMKVLARPRYIGPENISALLGEIIKTTIYIREQQLAPNFKIIKGQKTRKELGAMGRIDWRRWRVLANIVSQNGTSLELVGALHRDWGYEGGRVIFFG